MKHIEKLIIVIVEQLEQTIKDSIKAELKEYYNTVTVDETVEDVYLTRKETASLLKISLPTLNSWTKNGIIKSCKINTRVRYHIDAVKHALDNK